MSIIGIKQPDLLEIDNSLRLRKYDYDCGFALSWYQDEELVYLVDGRREPYTMEQLKRMYTYLDGHGELYWIEINDVNHYIPIGDVTFWQEDMPIVIGDKSFHGKHIGRKVIGALAKRAALLNYDTIYVREIYDFNTASRKCFESVGFEPYEKTEKGNRYRLSVKKSLET
ncbi:MAG: GNAT family N-acetyltransferase [Clostridiales bacterium]|nr:GNAT family N-acetyltransferase [Clostridiales bacterium]